MKRALILSDPNFSGFPSLNQIIHANFYFLIFMKVERACNKKLGDNFDQLNLHKKKVSKTTSRFGPDISLNMNLIPS